MKIKKYIFLTDSAPNQLLHALGTGTDRFVEFEIKECELTPAGGRVFVPLYLLL